MSSSPHPLPPRATGRERFHMSPCHHISSHVIILSRVIRVDLSQMEGSVMRWQFSCRSGGAGNSPQHAPTPHGTIYHHRAQHTCTHPHVPKMHREAQQKIGHSFVLFNCENLRSQMVLLDRFIAPVSGFDLAVTHHHVRKAAGIRGV